MRVDNANLENTIVRLENELASLKEAQIVGGTSHISYRYWIDPVGPGSPTQYDYVTTLPAGPSEKQITVTFTLDSNAINQQGGVVEFVHYASGIPNVMGGFRQPWATSTNLVTRQYEDADQSTATKRVYIITLVPNLPQTAQTFYFKWFAYGTVNGTVTSVQ